jgi:hypothetical protein
MVFQATNLAVKTYSAIPNIDLPWNEMCEGGRNRSMSQTFDIGNKFASNQMIFSDKRRKSKFK